MKCSLAQLLIPKDWKLHVGKPLHAAWPLLTSFPQPWFAPGTKLVEQPYWSNFA
jgi:hypothetical protein